MTDFNISNTDTPQGANNKFVRHQPATLQRIFGSADMVPYWIADMDFAIAEPITQELQRLAARSRFAYEFDRDSLFTAISSWFQQRHNLTLAPTKFVQVPSVLAGLALLVRELTESGDGVIIQTPVYHQFKKLINAAGREAVASPLIIEAGQYKMNFDDLTDKFRNHKVMLLCNPHNPVGRVWTDEELTQLLRLADQYGVTVISDEIHADIIYRHHTFNSITKYDGAQHIALIGSPAKTFGMQSIANGYIYTRNNQVLRQITQVTEAMYLGHGNAFTTFATIAAYQQGGTWLDELLTYLEGNLGWMESYIAHHLSGVQLYPVEGTYQMWLNFTDTGLTGKEVKQALVKAKMGLAPGVWFDSKNELFWRMNFAAPQHIIQSSFAHLTQTLA